MNISAVTQQTIAMANTAAAAADFDPTVPHAKLPIPAARAAGQQFEGILLRQILGDSLKPMVHGPLSGGGGAGVYQYLTTDVLAERLSQDRRGGLGIARMVEAQLIPVRKALPVEPTPSASGGEASSEIRR